jgi:hypothetical protein
MAAVLNANDVRRFGVKEGADPGRFRNPRMLRSSRTQALTAADLGFVTEWQPDERATVSRSCSRHPVSRRSRVSLLGSDR